MTSERDSEDAASTLFSLIPMQNSLLVAARMAAMMRRISFARAEGVPPKVSVRWFVAGERNWARR
jgi:hypothetical protein